MLFTASPADVMQLVNTARKLERDPVTLAGKLVGFGSEEQKAGVPAWAWLTVGVGVGMAIGWWLTPKVKNRLKAFE